MPPRHDRARSAESNRSHARAASKALLIIVVLELAASCGLGQIQAGVYDFGQNRWGEKRGSWTPGEWLAGILLIMTILLGLALSIGLCYYVNRHQAQKSTMKMNILRRQQLQISQQHLDASEPVDNSPVYQSYNYDRRQPRQQQQQREQLQRPTPNASLVVEI